VTLTVNTNLTTPLKSKSIKAFRLQSVSNNYTYIHSKNITLLLAHATNGCASRNKIGALGEVRFKTVALRGIPHKNIFSRECNQTELKFCDIIFVTSIWGTRVLAITSKRRHKE
ncbi:hypothetical protein SFRURICE_003132, partial [Spodoptera frugiperda]